MYSCSHHLNGSNADFYYPMVDRVDEDEGFSENFERMAHFYRLKVFIFHELFGFDSFRFGYCKSLTCIPF